MKRQLAEAEAQRAAEDAAAAAVGAPPPSIVSDKTDADAMATWITLFNKRFDNMDSMLAAERTEREKLEHKMRPTALQEKCLPRYEIHEA